MRKLVCLLLSLAATGGIAAATATSASASSYPPPCPVQPLVQFGNGSVSIHVGCLAPIVVTIPPIATPPHP